MLVETRRDKTQVAPRIQAKGIQAVYLEVSDYPRGKRELAHEWLRERRVRDMTIVARSQ